MQNLQLRKTTAYGSDVYQLLVACSADQQLGDHPYRKEWGNTVDTFSVMLTYIYYVHYQMLPAFHIFIPVYCNRGSLRVVNENSIHEYSSYVYHLCFFYFIFTLEPMVPPWRSLSSCIRSKRWLTVCARPNYLKQATYRHCSLLCSMRHKYPFGMSLLTRPLVSLRG